MRRWAATARSARGSGADQGCEGGRVQQVPRVQEEREDDDAEPREALADVADGRELRGAREREQAHRLRLDDGEAGFSSGQPVDEAEPGRGGHDPERVEQEPPPGGAQLVWFGHRPAAMGPPSSCPGGQRRKVFPQVPSQTTYRACFSNA